MEIARGRSCASVLVIPQRKMALVRALHERAAMARVGAPGRPWGARRSGREGEGMGRGEGARLGRYRGRGAMGRGAGMASCSLAAAAAVCEVEEGKKREKKKRKIDFFLNLEILGRKIKDNLCT
jgi:hypothetical protein